VEALFVLIVYNFSMCCSWGQIGRHPHGLIADNMAELRDAVFPHSEFNLFNLLDARHLGA
jgi:hypothetical protein